VEYIGGVRYIHCEYSFTNCVTSNDLARLMIVMILDFCVRDGSICSNEGSPLAMAPDML